MAVFSPERRMFKYWGFQAFVSEWIGFFFFVVCHHHRPFFFVFLSHYLSHLVVVSSIEKRKMRGGELGELGPQEFVSVRTMVLNIYDVVEHPFNYALAKYLTLGIHHTGVQVGSREFAFTLEGIVVTEPQRIPRCKLTHRVVLTRKATEDLVQTALSALQTEFTAATYDPLERNCNHFADAFCALVSSTRVPTWVNRAPTMASLLGTRFRLRPAKVTAPSLEWSAILVDAERCKMMPSSRRTRSTRVESLADDDDDSGDEVAEEIKTPTQQRNKPARRPSLMLGRFRRTKDPTPSPRPSSSSSPTSSPTNTRRKQPQEEKTNPRAAATQQQNDTRQVLPPTTWLDCLSEMTPGGEKKHKNKIHHTSAGGSIVGGLWDDDALLDSSRIVALEDTTTTRR